MEPIDDIDGNKKRRTMFENMQRSSALFQSKLKKTAGKSAEQTKAKQLPQDQQEADQLDFSSEFSNQNAGLNSGSSSDIRSGWQDHLDDDWLDDDDEDFEGDYQEDHDQGSHDSEQDEEGEDSGHSPPGPAPASQPESQSGKPSVEERLGFEWGDVQKKEPAARAGSGEPKLGSGSPSLGSGSPSLGSGSPTVGSGDPTVRRGSSAPFSAGRRDGYAGSVKPEMIIKQRVRPLGHTMLAPRGQLAAVEPAVAAAARLLIQTPEDEPGYEECLRLLSRFGLGAIRLCSRQKVKIHILDEGGFLRFPELAELGFDPEETPVDGAYLVGSRTCLIDRRCLMEKPRYFHPALYYFAHALDHAQGGEDFSSRKAAAVLACFDASYQGLHGCDFVDELAASDPVRYFARSISIYLGRDDCSEPIWTHQDLYDFDRSMYDYLQYLFARFS